MENDGFIVIEGIHENHNNINTLEEQTKTGLIKLVEKYDPIALSWGK